MIKIRIARFNTPLTVFSTTVTMLEDKAVGSDSVEMKYDFERQVLFLRQRRVGQDGIRQFRMVPAASLGPLTPYDSDAALIFGDNVKIASSSGVSKLDPTTAGIPINDEGTPKAKVVVKRRALAAAV